MRHGYTPENACKEAVMRIVRKSPAKSKEIQVGFLAINKKGEYGAYALQKGFSFAVKSANQDIVIPGKSYYP
jgi:N4-(beta-N-acetylglucosaminyl)-L-asparaginase